MSVNYSAFNLILIEKVTQAIKTQLHTRNSKRDIRIISNSKPTYTNVIPHFEKENSLLKTVDHWLSDALDEPINILPKTQETHILSPKAKEFLDQVDQIISKEHVPYTQPNDLVKIKQIPSDEPLLKRAFEHLGQTYHKKYKKMMDE